MTMHVAIHRVPLRHAVLPVAFLQPMYVRLRTVAVLLHARHPVMMLHRLCALRVPLQFRNLVVILPQFLVAHPLRNPVLVQYSAVRMLRQALYPVRQRCVEPIRKLLARHLPAHRQRLYLLEHRQLLYLPVLSVHRVCQQAHHPFARQVWEYRQCVPEEWVAEAARGQQLFVDNIVNNIVAIHNRKTARKGGLSISLDRSITS